MWLLVWLTLWQGCQWVFTPARGLLSGFSQKLNRIKTSFHIWRGTQRGGQWVSTPISACAPYAYARIPYVQMHFNQSTENINTHNYTGDRNGYPSRVSRPFSRTFCSPEYGHSDPVSPNRPTNCTRVFSTCSLDVDCWVFVRSIGQKPWIPFVVQKNTIK